MIYYCFSICYTYSVLVYHVGLLLYHLNFKYLKYQHLTSQKLVIDLYKIYLLNYESKYLMNLKCIEII